MSIKRIKKVCYEFRHYLIATACVLILTVVLLLTVVYPYNCQNVKLKFVDIMTSKSITNTRFNVCTRYSKPLGIIKTDSQGYGYLNLNYIEDKMLIIQNEDYVIGIRRHKSSKWRISIMYNQMDSCIRGFDENYNLYTGWITRNKEKIRKFDYITLLCLNYRKARERRFKYIMEDLLRNVHTFEEFKRKYPNIKPR